MGVVIHFPDIKRRRSSGAAKVLAEAGVDESTIAKAMLAAADQSAALAAAQPLLDLCCDRYGFTVMQEGLPREPSVFARVIIELFRALTMLDAEMCPPRTYPMFGVYFGRRQLVWFEDGYSGTTGLAVPNNIDAAELADFVRPRIAARLRSHH